MKITYLDHSGFAVECGDTLLVFDEYNPKPAQGKSGLAGGVVTEADVRAHAHSALLLSHSHSDHYCKEVLALPFESTVLSPDFLKRLSGTRLAEGESAALPGLAVRAFGSTDMGVSYLADLPGARIFHAGDYNLWHWEDESTEEEIREATGLQLSAYFPAAKMARLLRNGGPCSFCGNNRPGLFPARPAHGEEHCPRRGTLSGSHAPESIHPDALPGRCCPARRLCPKAPGLRPCDDAPRPGAGNINQL